MWGYYIKVKKLSNEVKDLCIARNMEGKIEYYTGDGTRIDLGILMNDGEEKVLAIEFEDSYKWIKQRTLYNALKAKRSGFEDILFVYPFNNKSIENSWIVDYIENELEMNMRVSKPDQLLEYVEHYLDNYLDKRDLF